MNNYSPNMLKIFDECPQKFFLKYIQKISLPQRSEIFEKGKKIHALANYYLNGEDISKMEKTLNSDEKIAWESLKNNKYFQLDVVNTEYNLSCKIDKYWIGGRLDALMCKNSKCKMEKKEIVSSEELVVSSDFVASQRNLTSQPSDNSIQKTPNSSLLTPNYYILDYKTGSIPQNAEYDFQTIIYLLCADKLFAKKGGYESLKFIYLGLKNNNEKEILLTEDLKKEYEEKVLLTCNKIDSAIKSNNYPKNEKCLNCEYFKLCT